MPRAKDVVDDGNGGGRCDTALLLSYGQRGEGKGENAVGDPYVLRWAISNGDDFGNDVVAVGLF
jgi:hypothetical protein